MGRLIVIIPMMVIVLMAVVSVASSRFVINIANLSRTGRLILAGVFSLALWVGWFYYNDGVDYLLWLYNVPARPADEKQFVSLTERALHAWSAERDSVEHKQKCTEQSHELAGSAAEVDHWTGTVATVYQLGAKAVLVVRIGRYTAVRTSFNDVADAILLNRGTSAFEQAAGLQSGDPVRFSGLPAPGADGCMFVLGSQAADLGAQVVFRFTSIEPTDR